MGFSVFFRGVAPGQLLTIVTNPSPMLMKSTLMSHTQRDKKIERGGATEEEEGHQQERTGAKGGKRDEYDQNAPRCRNGTHSTCG